MNPYSPLTRSDLYSLEKYSQIRSDFRQQVMAHKSNRRLALGEHVMLYFEDSMTMHYQIQEMLRAERIFESEGIEEELAAYNPLIPDGNNLKATMMVQYADVQERIEALSRLIGLEDKVWLQVRGHERVYPICDEDLERDNEEKTSAVHFLRFEFSDAMIADLKAGKPLAGGVDHPNYSATVDPVAENIAGALTRDFK
ncbi:MAG: DUF3501 family protein [Gammaproteobacteria bacterium]|nr:DUF3501 family protein [Gammaproteobacteria bacterium]